MIKRLLIIPALCILLSGCVATTTHQIISIVAVPVILYVVDDTTNNTNTEEPTDELDKTESNIR